MNRRDFLALGSGLAGITTQLQSCKPTERMIPGKIVGASAEVGHLLRQANSFPVKGEITTDVMIVGAGISGLSAARWLHKNGQQNFLIADLEATPGGNAKNGSNDISAYPWGAHYITIANNNLTQYTDFLKEIDIITGEENGLPVYNENYLCNDPEERLYINGKWQDGLVPDFGVSDDGKKQIRRFLQQMNSFRNAKGKDLLDAFAIPVDASSKDEEFTKLDAITMQQWMEQQQYNDPYLHWYVNYCTRDDFGTTVKEISAWAGIHYFAGRKGHAANATHSDVVTWPEGNNHLANHLSKDFADKIHCHHLVTKLTPQDDGWLVDLLDVQHRQVQQVKCQQVILATPQFVNCRLVNAPLYTSLVKEHLKYSPWMVANLTVNGLAEKEGQPNSWDNVWYTSESLGYVDATHQLPMQLKPQRNLTYYLPLTQHAPAAARQEALTKPHADWCRQIIADIQTVHTDIAAQVTNIDIMLWGHAMIQPRPGIIHNGIRKQIKDSLPKGLHLAHTDIAGISIFEEAFYQGIQAATEVLATI